MQSHVSQSMSSRYVESRITIHEFKVRRVTFISMYSLEHLVLARNRGVCDVEMLKFAGLRTALKLVYAFPPNTHVFYVAFSVEGAIMHSLSVMLPCITYTTLAIDLGLHGSWQNFICNVQLY